MADTDVPQTSQRVRFTPELEPQGTLGAEGFLNKFVVTFHAYENFFLVEQPDDWPRTD